MASALLTHLAATSTVAFTAAVARKVKDLLEERINGQVRKCLNDGELNIYSQS